MKNTSDNIVVNELFDTILC